MGFTHQQAADALGKSLSHVKNYEAGVDRKTKKPAIPDLATRIHMRLLAEGRFIEPWPDK
ncbi:MAG: hypothetical protein NW215_10730 [Hyphomicrobiales bacterium]|nr:hypothetical protein [Hyphomicrobiales bacterium]